MSISWGFDMKLIVFWYDGNDNMASLLDVQGEFFGPFGMTPEALELEGPDPVINSIVKMPDDCEEVSISLDDTGYLVVMPGAIEGSDWVRQQAKLVTLP
jgi:hypothetical protein